MSTRPQVMLAIPSDKSATGSLAWHDIRKLMEEALVLHPMFPPLRELGTQVSQSAASISVQDLFTVVKSNAYIRSIPQSTNFRDKDYNIATMRSSFFCLGAGYVTVEDIAAARLAFTVAERDIRGKNMLNSTFESSSNQSDAGIPLEFSALKQTLRLCGRVISPKKLKFWIRIVKSRTQFFGRVQLSEFIYLLCNADSKAKMIIPEAVRTTERNAKGVYEIEDMDFYTLSPDGRLETVLDSAFDLRESKERMAALYPEIDLHTPRTSGSKRRSNMGGQSKEKPLRRTAIIESSTDNDTKMDDLSLALRNADLFKKIRSQVAEADKILNRAMGKERTKISFRNGDHARCEQDDMDAAFDDMIQDINESTPKKPYSDTRANLKSRSRMSPMLMESINQFCNPPRSRPSTALSTSRSSLAITSLAHSVAVPRRAMSASLTSRQHRRSLKSEPKEESQTLQKTHSSDLHMDPNISWAAAHMNHSQPDTTPVTVRRSMIQDGRRVEKHPTPMWTSVQIRAGSSRIVLPATNNVPAKPAIQHSGASLRKLYQKQAHESATNVLKELASLSPFSISSFSASSASAPALNNNTQSTSVPSLMLSAPRQFSADSPAVSEGDSPFHRLRVRLAESAMAGVKREASALKQSNRISIRSGVKS
eukprot:GILJ01008221.1.p1 GENE.GILJ01008221.1~~GILJ01008221.1.p1  ORF type:complete len:651 (-),score=98.22 GILJ01008221.1:380-2332(-)